MSPEKVEETIVALERAALDRWCKGDPYGFVDNAVDDVTYFDHVTKTRIDGIAALKDHARQFVDKVDVPHYQMPNAKVRSVGDIAVLTFNWEAYSRDGTVASRWNATEVFVRSEGYTWKYAHMHWAPVVTQGA
ncbi:MAG: YybH family protein [Vicinamibacterales bacterium]